METDLIPSEPKPKFSERIYVLDPDESGEHCHSDSLEKLFEENDIDEDHSVSVATYVLEGVGRMKQVHKIEIEVEPGE